MGLLDKTICTVIGPMEADIKMGRLTRELIISKLEPIGIRVWNHYNRPYMGFIEESEETHEALAQMRDRGDYDAIANYKDIRAQDLSMIDRSDIIICIFNHRVFSAGTMEEIVWANRCKKPIFLVWEEGKNKCPFWFFWMLPHKYIYSSIDEAVNMILQIDSGEKEIDSSRWRLLKPEFR